MNLEEEFQQKYPMEDREWILATASSTCDSCNIDVVYGELFSIGLTIKAAGVLCSRCSIDEYNALQKNTVIKTGHVGTQIAQLELKEYEDSDWMIMSDGSCYFCGRSHICNHMR